jgi:hypothetical protein
MSHIPRPILPLPPPEYASSYFERLVRSITIWMNQVENPSEARHSELTLTGLQGYGAGLRDGEIYEDAGILKIVRSTDVFAAPLSATGSVGTVTVAIS